MSPDPNKSLTIMRYKGNSLQVTDLLQVCVALLHKCADGIHCLNPA